MANKIIFVTGGAGFIGSAVIRQIINSTEHKVINIDNLTYAGNLDSLRSVEDNTRYVFERLDICDGDGLKCLFKDYRPDIVMHLAAESHVDRSIDSPYEFIQTNVVGTCVLLQETRLYWSNLEHPKKDSFRFHHVSTDEVYGDLGESGGLFTEETPYNPSSPYSASKAGSDHLVRAWHRTFGLPTLITNCSNNYGPYQFPEKLIPLVIRNALIGEPLPVYGDGGQVRDWLFVDDHATALLSVALYGREGQTYNIGGHNEVKNIDVVTSICSILDELTPSKFVGIDRYSQLIVHVEDRAGHDIRYAIDAGKIQKDLGWKPRETFTSGLRKTVAWYLNNPAWCENALNGSHKNHRVGEGK